MEHSAVNPPTSAAEADLPIESPPATRMLFLGDARLADGFRLIGFETRADPDADEVERLLGELLRTRATAFVVVDEALMALPIRNLHRLRREGGRIVVIAVPAIGTEPLTLSGEIAARVAGMFGNGDGT